MDGKLYCKVDWQAVQKVGPDVSYSKDGWSVVQYVGLDSRAVSRAGKSYSRYDW